MLTPGPSGKAGDPAWGPVSGDNGGLTQARVAPSGLEEGDRRERFPGEATAVSATAWGPGAQPGKVVWEHQYVHKVADSARRCDEQ